MKEWWYVGWESKDEQAETSEWLLERDKMSARKNDLMTTQLKQTMPLLIFLDGLDY